MLVDEIEKRLDTSATIKFIFKGGSAILCNNCKDTDLIVVAENHIGIKRFTVDNYDIFVYTIEEFKKFATTTLNDHRDNYSIAVGLATGDNVVYGSNPIEKYNWFNYKKQIVQKALDNFVQYFGNGQVVNSQAPNCCLKRTYWIFANYFALTNNSFDFTQEQLDIIQKCHDNELPRSYAEDLYNKLLEMQASQEVLNENIN